MQKKLKNDGWTNRPMDRVGHRVACTRLKKGALLNEIQTWGWSRMKEFLKIFNNNSTENNQNNIFDLFY